MHAGEPLGVQGSPRWPAITHVPFTQAKGNPQLPVQVWPSTGEVPQRPMPPSAPKMQRSACSAHELPSVQGWPVATFGVQVRVVLEQKSVARQSFADVHGVEGPAAWQIFAASQYFAAPHSKPTGHGSPTIGSPQLPRVPTPPSALTMSPRHCSPSALQLCVLLHGWPVSTSDAYVWQVRSTVSQLVFEAQSA